MSDPRPETELRLAAPDDTARLGRWLAGCLQPGDTVLLQGPIGSGKSHLARSVIQSWLGQLEDVPSPTYTLVQTYGKGDAEIWHADLYRLSHPDEVIELGLDDAFGRAICLVEWPERLGRATPDSALRLTFSQDGEGRRVVLTGSAEWAERLSQIGGYARA
jgi:tRNA threonylcarbamoyladenosine biosynthesis protein TsaE